MRTSSSRLAQVELVVAKYLTARWARFIIRLAAVAWRNKPLMKTKMLFAALLTLVLCTAGYAQTLDKAKLDQLFDRLLEKNKGMGSLVLTKDGNVIYSRSFGYSQSMGTKRNL
jgi:hypothetical protein